MVVMVEIAQIGCCQMSFQGKVASLFRRWRVSFEGTATSVSENSTVPGGNYREREPGFIVPVSFLWLSLMRKGDLVKGQQLFEERKTRRLQVRAVPHCHTFCNKGPGIEQST